MNSREIVRRTLDYEGPERVARSFAESDFAHAGNTVRTRATEWCEAAHGRWERLDEWGNTWARVDATSKGEVARGVLDGVDDFGACEFPDYSNPADYEAARTARAGHPDKYLIGGMPGFAFSIARKLRRLDQYLMDLVTEPGKVHELHDRIDVMIEHMIRNYAAAGVDCVMFCEDWGTQAALMIDPKLWRREFYPRFEKLCGIAHDREIRVFMHSCGQTEEIVPDLMRAGVDCLQFDQPELHGIDRLASHQEEGKITFWCPVDIQTTLQSGDEELIRARAREMLDRLWRGRGPERRVRQRSGRRGGFVAGYYGDNASIGLDPKWQRIACDEFVARGVGQRYPASA